MDKEKLIKLAEDLYQSAFDANAYYAIMMQYREMSKKYNDEMNLSPAFYQVVYGMKCMRQQGMMHAMRHIEMVLLLQRMAQIYLPCLRKRLKMAQGMNFILIDGWNMLRMAGKKKMI